MMIYEQLQKAMRVKRVKQKRAADLMGITPSRLCRLLSGDRGLPAGDFLALCLVLGENPSDYFGCDELATARLRLSRGKGEEEEDG